MIGLVWTLAVIGSIWGAGAVLAMLVMALVDCYARD